MKEIINDFIEMATVPYDDNWTSWILIILVWIVSIIIIVLIGWGVLYALDSWFLETSEGVGQVICKEYIESHTSTSIINGTVHTTHHPDAWSITIELEEKEDTFYLDEDEYVTILCPQQIEISYSIGRIFKGLYIKSIHT